jgi:hypothetical protein
MKIRLELHRPLTRNERKLARAIEDYEALCLRTRARIQPVHGRHCICHNCTRRTGRSNG